MKRLSWNKLDKFLEATSIEWHYFFHITINTTVPATPRLLFLFCRFIRAIVVAAVALIVFIADVVSSAFLIIVILYRYMFGITGLKLI